MPFPIIHCIEQEYQGRHKPGLNKLDRRPSTQTTYWGLPRLSDNNASPNRWAQPTAPACIKSVSLNGFGDVPNWEMDCYVSCNERFLCGGCGFLISG